MSSTWLQLEAIAGVLDLFPAVFLAAIVTNGLLGRLSVVKRLASDLWRPFQAFLRDDELSEYSNNDPRPLTQSWKTLILAAVSAALAAVWIYAGAFDAISVGVSQKDVILSFVTAATWVIFVRHSLSLRNADIFFDRLPWWQD